MVFDKNKDTKSWIPSASAGPGRRSRRGNSRRKRSCRPKYRVMVMHALKALTTSKGKGCSYNAIAKYIEERYHIRNDFVLKHVINWLCRKRVLRKKGTRVVLTGKPFRKNSASSARRNGKRRRSSRQKKRSGRRRVSKRSSKAKRRRR